METQATENKPVTPGLSIISADELNAAKIEQPYFCVAGLLPTGLSLLCAPPKYGKSWLSLDLAVSVATGTEFLGFPTKKSPVLLLALEDSEARLQTRLRKVLNGRSAPAELSISTKAATLQQCGLTEQLADHINKNPETRLVIIDTFQKIRGDVRRGESAYSYDYRETGVLKSFADERKICILLVHHLRKMQDVSDTFANISGTNGLTGAADTMLVLSRDKRADKTTLLSITGRDVEMMEYQVEFKKTTCRWKIIGTAEEAREAQEIAEYNSNNIVKTIKKLLEMDKTGWSGTASEFLSASKLYGTPVYDSSKAIGKNIEKIQDKLFQYDGIIYHAAKNGTGGKKYTFCHASNPFAEP